MSLKLGKYLIAKIYYHSHIVVVEYVNSMSFTSIDFNRNALTETFAAQQLGDAPERLFVHGVVIPDSNDYLALLASESREGRVALDGNGGTNVDCLVVVVLREGEGEGLQL